MQFRGASGLAREMNEIASDYTPIAEPTAIPRMKNIRLGINVAACDSLPAIVVMGESDEQITELAEKLSPAAWHADLAGKYIYSSTTDADEVSVIEGLEPGAGYAIVEPDAYGQTARVLSQIDADATAEQIQTAMLEVAQSFKRPIKDHGSHVRGGKRAGAEWETEIPVEDPMALRAQQGRGSGGRGRGRDRE